MTLYQKLRSLHLATALFSLLFLIAFAIGAVEFAHGKWVGRGETSTVETRRLSPGITDARILARAWRGELSSIEAASDQLEFRVSTSLGKVFEVTYSIATGEATVKTTIPSFLRTFAWIHVSRGIWAWGSVLVSLALITLGVSGISLWFQNRKERWIGVALIVGEVGIALGLILIDARRLTDSTHRTSVKYSLL
jgi:hypothetical protein